MESNMTEKKIPETHLSMVFDSIAYLDINNLLKEAFTANDLYRKIEEKENIYLICVGKVSINMATAITNLIPNKITNSFIVSLESSDLNNNFISSHPNPSQNSHKCALNLINFLTSATLTDRDMVIFAISGGTSAMLMAPTSHLSLEELIFVNEKLLQCGEDVSTINKVRKAISELHGGGILRYLGNAEVYSFILCDNVQKDLPSVGSGLTFDYDVEDEDLTKVLNNINISEKLKRKILRSHYDKINKQKNLKRSNVKNIMLADTKLAVQSLENIIKSRGYEVIVLTDSLQGEAKEVAKVLGSIYRYHTTVTDRKLSIICAGEVTVTVKGNGKGGRCQELAWCVAKEIESIEGDVTFISFATDGNDYISNVSGCWVSNKTMRELYRKNISWEDTIQNNNTFHGLKQLEQLITNIKTNTNLCDLYVFFRE
jgi:glycerate 2-kinase